jgi:hypothetical protein
MDDHLLDTTVKVEMMLTIRQLTYISEEITTKQALKTRLLGSDDGLFG